MNSSHGFIFDCTKALSKRIHQKEIILQKETEKVLGKEDAQILGQQREGD